MSTLKLPFGSQASTVLRHHVHCKPYRPGRVERSILLARETGPHEVAPQSARRWATISCISRGNASARASDSATADEGGVIPAEELIQLTKDWVSTFNGVSEKQAATLSEEFVFRGPVVGPLNKAQYVFSLNGFKFHEAFPDIETKAFGFSIDPQDPYRVWFFTQTTGTHTQPLASGGGSGVVMEPTGEPIRNGTEAASVIWTPDRKIRYASGGYCVDRIHSNTPRGTMRVAGVGILRAAGFTAIWALFTNRVVQFVMNVVYRLRGAPKEARFGATPWAELPQWWRDLPDGGLRGAQRYYA